MSDIVKKILEKGHDVIIDPMIEGGAAPSIIREDLVRRGIDCYSVDEITEYVKHHYQTVMNRAFTEHEDLYATVNNSVPVLLADPVLNNSTDEQRRANYHLLLELDVLRAENLMQQVLAGKYPKVSIDAFRKLSKIKENVVHSLATLLEYKKAIQEMKLASYRANRVDMGQIDSYLNQLNDHDRAIALETIHQMLQSRTQEPLTLPHEI